MRLNQLQLGRTDVVLVVEQLRSPGNLGTILRTAEAVGCKAAVFVGPLSDPFCPSAVRASMGSLFAIPVVRTSAAQFREWATRRGVVCIGLSPEAKPVWASKPVDSPVALLIGEERKGLSTTMRSMCDATISLPMVGQADSLNVAIATGVILYEFARRRAL